MKKPPTPEQIRAVMAELGRRTSKHKAEASRKNGKKGGRPRKLDTKVLSVTFCDPGSSLLVTHLCHPFLGTPSVPICQGSL